MSSPSPGWYPDPNSPDNLRFYDGDGWTRSVVPVPADGRLTKEMVATGRKIMQEKASSKFEHASFTPTASEPVVSSRRAHADAAGLATTKSSSSAQSPASAASSAHARDKASATDSLEKASEKPAVTVSPEVSGSPSTTVAAARRAADIKANVSETSVSESGAEEPDASEPSAAGPEVSASGGDSADAPVRRSLLRNRSSALAGADRAQSSAGKPSADSDVSATSADSAGGVESPGSVAAPDWTKNRTDKHDTVNKDFSATEIEPEKARSKPAMKRGKRNVLMLGAAVVVVALLAVAYYVFMRDDPSGDGTPSDDYRSLGLKDSFGCEELSREVMAQSQRTEEEREVTAINDVTMVKDNRSGFVLPSTTGSYEVAFTCRGSARYADGETEDVTFDLSADKSSRFWTTLQ